QNLQQPNFGQLRQPIQQQIQQTPPIQNLDHGIIAFDNSLSFQKMTNDNNNNNTLVAQSLPLPQQHHQLVYVKSNPNTSYPSSINNDINNDHHYNLNFSSFNTRNSNEEDPLVAISHHMSIIKDYMMKIDQHYLELEQIVNINMLRRRNN